MASTEFMPSVWILLRARLMKKIARGLSPSAMVEMISMPLVIWPPNSVCAWRSMSDR
ncbi:MAG: hypothetical protein IPO08_20230 [Xanthomonadales bacterium]|nr:hypothetical protein [Xanthomonadales bacterium]